MLEPTPNSLRSCVATAIGRDSPLVFGCRTVSSTAMFGFASIGLTPSDFECPDGVVQLGVPPGRIDLITSITGVSWDEAWASKVTGCYGDIPVFYIGRAQFVANKRATGRTKDVADLEVLGEV